MRGGPCPRNTGFGEVVGEEIAGAKHWKIALDLGSIPAQQMPLVVLLQFFKETANVLVAWKILIYAVFLQ